MLKSDFCEGWLFCGDQGEMSPVLLPHDATQTSGRDAGAPSGSGGAYYLDGYYTYTKRFFAPVDWEHRYLSLLFEGVYPQARVLLNGSEVGACAYGYSQFEVVLCGLKYGAENEITVIVDNTQLPNSRWYAGAGIHRPVWLLEGAPSHIIRDGISVTTLSCEPARIRVQTEYSGEGQVSVEILYHGEVVTSGEGGDVTLSVPDARLWDAEHPNLYTCRVMLKAQGSIMDTAETTFGIRMLSWNMNGFFVNGKKVLLKGGCIHHDNGILGCRAFDEAEWRRIRILKKWGFNAIRSAHNPLSRAALEACDDLGLYVMDETWDMWDQHKNPHDYAARFPQNWRQDVRQLVKKDRNHPCVVMYSIGNEVTEPAKPEGVQLAAEIIKEVKSCDPTRPVTAGINITLLMMAKMGINVFEQGEPKKDQEVSSTAFNEMAAQNGARMVMAAAGETADKTSTPVLDLLDIAGYNYAQSRYENEPAIHPERVIVGSETYPQDIAENWKLIEKCPWVIGDFMWTAWDYLGEVGIGGWVYEPSDMSFAKPYPWKLADTGALDILGDDNAEAGLAAAVWGALDRPYIAARPMSNHSRPWAHAMWRGSNAIPSWSWRGCEGEMTEIEVYTSAETIEVFLNGTSLGKQVPVNCKTLYQTVYHPGTLIAVATDRDGTKTVNELQSAEGDCSIAIVPEEQPQIGKVLFVKINLQGMNGEIESNADTRLTVSVQGGELLAFGSARPKTEEDFSCGTYATYFGKSLAAIRVTDAVLNITVTGDGLKTEAYRAEVQN